MTPPGNFHVRVTCDEADVIELLIARWAADMLAQGIPVPAEKTAWFRSLLNREARRVGVEPP